MPKQKDAEVSHDKPCTLCGTPRSVLVRCQIDESGKWNFVCPGKCWRSVSGGVEDAKGHKDEFPSYKYGGMWKNKHADGPISAKKPKRVKARIRQQAQQDLGGPGFDDDAAAAGGESDASDQSENGTEGRDANIPNNEQTGMPKIG